MSSKGKRRSAPPGREHCGDRRCQGRRNGLDAWYPHTCEEPFRQKCDGDDCKFCESKLIFNGKCAAGRLGC